MREHTHSVKSNVGELQSDYSLPCTDAEQHSLDGLCRQARCQRRRAQPPGAEGGAPEVMEGPRGSLSRQVICSRGQLVSTFGAYRESLLKAQACKLPSSVVTGMQ
jgi:hypothetical protein